MHGLLDVFLNFVFSHSMQFLMIVVVIVAAVFCIYLILASDKKPLELNNEISAGSTTITRSDIVAVSGESEITTQLDLARAYVELGKTLLAKNILEHVKLKGNEEQKQIAEDILLKI